MNVFCMYYLLIDPTGMLPNQTMFNTAAPPPPPMDQSKPMINQNLPSLNNPLQQQPKSKLSFFKNKLFICSF